jgi:ribosome-binding protein aMBF1 (putative translation factor)
MAGESFGTRLRSLRERAGMSQSELAEIIEADQSHIAAWEWNATLPEAGPQRHESLRVGGILLVNAEVAKVGG